MNMSERLIRNSISSKQEKIDFILRKSPFAESFSIVNDEMIVSLKENDTTKDIFSTMNKVHESTGIDGEFDIEDFSLIFKL